MLLSGYTEGLLESALIATRLFGLAAELLLAREDNLVHGVSDAFQHLRDVVAAVLLHQAADDVHIHRPSVWEAEGVMVWKCGTGHQTILSMAVGEIVSVLRIHNKGFMASFMVVHHDNHPTPFLSYSNK